MHSPSGCFKYWKMKIVTCSKKIVPQSLFLILVLVDLGGCSPKVVPSFSSPSGPMRKHPVSWWYFEVGPKPKRKNIYTQIIINIAHMPYFSVRYNPPNELHTFNFSLSKSIRTWTPATCICRAAKVVSENSSHAEKMAFFSKKNPRIMK